MITVLPAENLIPVELTMALTPEVIDQVILDVMSSARAFWIAQAGLRLHSTLRDYVDGIREVVMERRGASITLAGVLPNLIEGGMSAYDMHDTLLGPQVPISAGPGQRGKRQNKDGGFYRAIPFRHQVPGTAGKGGGAPMGSAYFRSLPAGLAGRLQSDLGKAIHRAALRLKPSTGLPGGPVSWGGRLRAGVGGVGLLRPHHSADIYAGMVKKSKSYAPGFIGPKQAAQNTYTTFRMISDSQPNKWLHPGIPAANILDDVVHHVEKIAPRAFLAAAWSD